MTLALPCSDLGLHLREVDLGSMCVFPYILLSVVWYILHAFGHIPYHQCGPEILVKPEEVKPLGEAEARYGLTVVFAVADH